MERIKDILLWTVLLILGTFLLAINLLAAEGKQALAPAPAASYCLLCVDSIDLRYQKFKEGRRDPYAPGWDSEWDYRAGLEWNLQLLRWGFWENDVHTEALESGIVKTVGWHWRLGIRLPFMRSEIFHEHHSRHVMDEGPRERDGGRIPANRFPVEDSIGLRMNLYRR
jgi:hypothetical protein